MTFPPFLTTDVHLSYDIPLPLNYVCIYIHTLQIYTETNTTKERAPSLIPRERKKVAPREISPESMITIPTGMYEYVRSGRRSVIISDQSIYCRHVNIVLMFHCVLFHNNLCLIHIVERRRSKAAVEAAKESGTSSTMDQCRSYAVSPGRRWV